MRRGSEDVRLPPWWVELLVLLLAYVAYQVVQVLVTGSAGEAIARARDLWSVERHLHLDPEVVLNHLLAVRHTLGVLVGVYYTTMHFLVTSAVLIWLRLRRPRLYVPLRNTLVGVSLTALVVFWLLPLAPPRLAIASIVDTSKVDNVVAAGPSWPASLANEYAAMPSLHVAWAVWAALAVAVAIGAGPGRYLVWGYPVATTLVVLATGNHFLADAVAGTSLVFAVWFLLRARGPDEGISGLRASPVDLGRGQQPHRKVPGTAAEERVAKLRVTTTTPSGAVGVAHGRRESLGLVGLGPMARFWQPGEAVVDVDPSRW